MQKASAEKGLGKSTFAKATADRGNLAASYSCELQRSRRFGLSSKGLFPCPNSLRLFLPGKLAEDTAALAEVDEKFTPVGGEFDELVVVHGTGLLKGLLHFLFFPAFLMNKGFNQK